MLHARLASFPTGPHCPFVFMMVKHLFQLTLREKTGCLQSNMLGSSVSDAVLFCTPLPHVAFRVLNLVRLDCYSIPCSLDYSPSFTSVHHYSHCWVLQISFNFCILRTYTAGKIWDDRDRNGSLKSLTWTKVTSKTFFLIHVHSHFL